MHSDSHFIGAEGLSPIATNFSPAEPHDGQSAADAHPVSRLEVWAARSSVVTYVIFCVWVGMMLAVIPWTPAWVNNGLIADHPMLRSLVEADFTRGLVTGVGLIDIFLGIWEAVHYRDPGKRP